MMDEIDRAAWRELRRRRIAERDRRQEEDERALRRLMARGKLDRLVSVGPGAWKIDRGGRQCIYYARTGATVHRGKRVATGLRAMLQWLDKGWNR